MMPRSRRRIKARRTVVKLRRAPDIVKISDHGKAMLADGLDNVRLSDGAKVAILIAAKIGEPISRGNLASLIDQAIAACGGDVALALSLLENGEIGVEPVS